MTVSDGVESVTQRGPEPARPPSKWATVSRRRHYDTDPTMSYQSAANEAKHSTASCQSNWFTQRNYTSPFHPLLN